MGYRDYEVLRKVNETPNTISVFLKAGDGAALDTFHAGQYLTFEIPGIGERQYALSAFSPEPKIYRITVVHGGEERNGTGHGFDYWLRAASRGDLLKASGPSGSFHLPATLDKPIVILSKDIGEAVVAAIAEELAIRAPRHPAVFLHSTFNSATFALKGKLGSLKADLPNAVWKVWFSNPRPFDRQGKEYDEAGAPDIRGDANLLPRDEFDAYICGPADFVASMATALQDIEVPCRKLFTASMGSRIEPPAEIAQEEEFPPLEPRAVTFLRTGQQATWTPESGTLLEFVEHLGIPAPFSCRTGMCGKCAQKVVSGKVAKIREISAKTREHCQLLCSNIPITDLEIDL